MTGPTVVPSPGVASALDPCARLAQLRAVDPLHAVNADRVLLELRMHVNALGRERATLDGADLRRQCVFELMCLLDRFLTLGGRPPTDWLAAFVAADRVDA